MPVYEKIDILESAFRDDIIDHHLWKFIPYIQLHEFETLLFSNLDCFAVFDNPKSLANLKNEIEPFSNIELINDNKETAPSKRIIKHFSKYKKSKTTDAPRIYNSIPLKLIRDKCKHFSDWVGKLEKIK